MVTYSSYRNPIKLNTEAAGVLEDVEKFVNNLLPSRMVGSSKLVDAPI